LSETCRKLVQHFPLGWLAGWLAVWLAGWLAGWPAIFLVPYPFYFRFDFKHF